MIIWVHNNAVFTYQDQRAEVLKVTDSKISIRLLGTDDKLEILPQDIVGFELDNLVICTKYLDHGLRK